MTRYSIALAACLVLAAGVITYLAIRRWLARAGHWLARAGHWLACAWHRIACAWMQCDEAAS